MLFRDGKCTDEVKSAIGVKDYMNTSSADKDVYELDAILHENSTKSFMQLIENWGNSYNKAGRALAVLNYVGSSKENAEVIFKFCWQWVNMMAYLNKPGHYDDRNELSVKVCSELISMFRNLDGLFEGDFGFDDIRLDYLVIYSLHRTIMQSLSHCFLIGLYASAVELGKDDIVSVFKEYFDVYDDGDEVSILREIRFPMV